MAEAMLRLLRDEYLRRETGRRGRARYERLFEFEPLYQKLLALYAELAQ